MRLAAGLLGLTLGLEAARQASAAPVEVRYVCRPAGTLAVTRSQESATVRFMDRTFKLRRKPSSVGAKYLSGSAALIIDGRTAVFVAGDRPRPRTCIEAAREGTQ